MPRVYVTLPKGAFLNESEDVYRIPGRANKWSLPEGTTEFSVEVWINVAYNENGVDKTTRVNIYLPVVQVGTKVGQIQERIDSILDAQRAMANPFSSYSLSEDSDAEEELGYF